MDRHKDALAKICRVGGKKLPKSSRCNGYPARDFAGQLQGCLGISVDDDQEGVHPPSICTICRRLLGRYQAAVDVGRPYAYGGGGCGEPRQWTPHSRTCCMVCSQLEQDSVGGRPKKKEASHDNQEEDLEVERLVPPVDAQTVGHDQGEGASPHVDEAGTSVMSKAASTYLDEPEYTPGTDMSIDRLFVIATPDFKPNADSLLTSDRLQEDLSDILCSICKMILNQGVCQQFFCSQCIWTWLDTTDSCPACRKRLVASSLVRMHPRCAGILARISLTCEYASDEHLGCHERPTLEDLRFHVQNCPFRPGATPHSPLRRVVTPSTTVKEILTFSPSKLRGDVSDGLLYHLHSCKQQGGTLELRTAGKPQTWHRITKGQTPSSDAADRTVRRRTEEVNSVRAVVSAGSSTEQQADELRRMQREEQDELLRAAGFAPNIGAGRGSGLALKADLSLPWSKLRKLRRWLSSFGVKLDSEVKMREQIHEELPFALPAELVPLVAKGGSVALKPVVCFPDLVGLVEHYLSQHHLAGSLSWHEGVLPNDEVWVKIGGDHGGGSFKFSLQIANTTQPNALHNTIPFLVFAAPDSSENLATTLRPYHEQIEQLVTTTWSGKSIRCVLIGHYELLCVCYGLSGPSGRRPCLYCLMSKAEMQLPLSEQPACEPRSLESLKIDHERFKANGSRLQRAKEFNNVIRPSLIPIALDWVCIPALHLDLGIYGWMFDAFLADMRALDVQLASHLGKTGLAESDSALFTEAACISSQISDISKKRLEIQAKIKSVQAQVCEEQITVLHKLAHIWSTCIC